MENNIIGRTEEIAALQEALTSRKAEMISVVGRRRVGKTYLIKTVYQGLIDFEITGLQDAPRSEQLQNFAFQLTRTAQSDTLLKTPSNWLEAFITLISYLEAKSKKGKLVVFLDELSWMATHKSGFLRGLSFFWNSWATNQQIVVVVCGSVASWMIQKVVNHKGGLHNRLTRQLHLEPFTLLETEAYLKNNKVYFDRYQIVQLYMAMGGIPHYLEAVKAGKSAIQNIDQICFSKNGLLHNEFSRLYASLFTNADNYISIIRVLGQKRLGLTRKQITDSITLKEGGTVQKVLNDLVQSDFISIYRPFGKKKKGKLYRLTDEYSLFYLQFMENKEHEGEGIWQHLSQTQAFKSWSGYAFESICLKHIPQIKKALSIAGIYSLSASFYKKGTATKKGTQIDLLIDRNDHIINLFEIKFYNEVYTIDKAYATQLRTKMRLFREATRTTKQLSWVLLTTFGLQENQHSLGLIHQTLTMEDLFC